jgi:hypothetical protein
MSWDIIARALFVDNNAAAGLKKFNDQVHDVAKAAPGGTRGIRMFESGLRSLAFQAAGTAGPVGSAVGGLLQFSGGAGLVVGASIGIGLVGAAFKEMAADAKLAADNVEAAAKRIRESIAAAAKKAGGEGAEGVARFEQRIAEAQARLESLRTSPLGPQRFGATVGGLVPLGSPEEDRAADIRNTESLLGQLTVGLNAASKAAEEAAQRAIDSATRQADVMQMTVMIRERAIATGQDENTTLIQVAEVTARAAAAAAHLDSTQTAALVTQAMRNERLKEENRVLEAQRDLLQEIDQISADVSKLFATPQFQATLQSIRVPNLAQLQGAETARQVNLAGDKLAADAISRSLIGVGMGRTSDIGHAAAGRQNRCCPNCGGDRCGRGRSCWWRCRWRSERHRGPALAARSGEVGGRARDRWPRSRWDRLVVCGRPDLGFRSLGRAPPSGRTRGAASHSAEHRPPRSA